MLRGVLTLLVAVPVKNIISLPDTVPYFDAIPRSWHLAGTNALPDGDATDAVLGKLTMSLTIDGCHTMLYLVNTCYVIIDILTSYLSVLYLGDDSGKATHKDVTISGEIDKR